MVDPQPSQSFLALAAILGAVVIGAIGATQPTLLISVPALVIVLGFLVFARRFTTRGLAACVFILLLAATKFRRRDAAASLAGEADTQVLLELGLYALLAVVFGMIWWSRRLRLRPLGRIEILLFLYVVVAISSSLWSDAPRLTLSRGIQLAVVYFAALVFVRTLTPDRVLGTLATPLIGYVLLFATLAVFLPSVSGGVVQNGLARFSWFAVHPITAATLAGIAALLLCLRLLADSDKQYQTAGRIWLWLPTAALIGVAVLTRSRGPLIAFLGALMVAVMVRRLNGAAAAALGSIVLVGGLIMANTGTTLIGLLSDWSADEGALGSLVFRGQAADAIVGFSGRARLWAETWPLFIEEPWLGRGFQGSRADLLEFASWSGHAHNAVLQSMLDLGLVGSILLFAAFASIFFVGPIRSPLVEPRLRLTRVMVIGIGMFELLNAISNQSFAGAPGYETLMLFTAICLAERLRSSFASRQSVHPTRFNRPAATAHTSWGTHAESASTAASSPSP